MPDPALHPVSPLLAAERPLGDDNAKLGQMCPQSIDEHGALAHQQIAGPYAGIPPGRICAGGAG